MARLQTERQPAIIPRTLRVANRLGRFARDFNQIEHPEMLTGFAYPQTTKLALIQSPKAARFVRDRVGLANHAQSQQTFVKGSGLRYRWQTNYRTLDCADQWF